MENNAQPVLEKGTLGPYETKNRLVCCALTRTRAGLDGVPTDLTVEYYTAKAEDAGMVLTECSWISKDGNAFPHSTGIANDE